MNCCFKFSRKGFLSLMLCAAVLLPACGNSTKYRTNDKLANKDQIRIHARIWKPGEVKESFPENEMKYLDNEWGERANNSFGIAFSGGGSRSASATLGQLRALHKLGWLEKAKYISAISGGSWTATAYTYLPQGQNKCEQTQQNPDTSCRSITDDEFLGTYTPPKDITENFFKEPNGEYSGILHKARIYGPYFLPYGVFSDERFADIVGRNFLGKILPEYRKRFFTLNEKSRNDIVKRNSDLKPWDFYLPAPRRPYLIVSSTLMTKGSSPKNMYPLEMTPLYTGIRASNYGSGKKGRTIGGMYIESLGYDSKTPCGPKENEVDVDLGSEKHRLTLSDVVGSSGAAVQKGLHSPWLRIAGLVFHNLGTPEFRYWAPDDDCESGTEEYAHGDGGHIDNLGLMPLLARRVKNILVFLNTRERFKLDDKGRPEIMRNLAALFVHDPKYPHINVIDDSGKLKELIEVFENRKGVKMKNPKERPLVHCDKYLIKRNGRHKIPAPENPDDLTNICWVYLDRNAEWEKIIKMKKELYEEVFKKPNFDYFPHFSTANVNLANDQVNALANLAAWTVMKESSYLAKHLNIPQETKSKSP